MQEDPDQISVVDFYYGSPESIIVALLGLIIFLTAFRLGPLLQSLRRAGVSKIEESSGEAPGDRP